MISLSDLRVRIMSKPKPYGSGKSSRPMALGLREATLADLRAVLEAEGATVLPTNSIEDDEFGELLPVLYVEDPGIYLVWRIEEVDSE